MKTISLRCANNQRGRNHEVRPTDGTTMLCLWCDFEVTVLEHAFVMTALSEAQRSVR